MPGSDLTFPLVVDGLVPGTSYSFFVTAFKGGIFNTSETIVWCTSELLPAEGVSHAGRTECAKNISANQNSAFITSKGKSYNISQFWTV